MKETTQRSTNEVRTEIEKKPTDGARKDSLDNAKFSTETLSRDSTLRELSKIFSGIFGSLILFSAINNSLDTIKNKNKNTWIFARTFLEFTTSGVLIGYSINQTLIGVIIGSSIGIVIMITQIKISQDRAN